MEPASISFSYKHLRDQEPFPLENCTAEWLRRFLSKLRDYSSWRPGEVFTRASGQYCHPIDWSETTVPDGFPSMSEEIQDSAWQLGITKSEGRFHGFFVGTVFYVVWLDPDHVLYPSGTN